MKAYIFANGDYIPPLLQLEIKEGDLVIAADGGSRHCKAVGIQPAVLIGDMDSTDSELIDEWEDEGVEIIRHPEDKDQTDLELAILLAQEKGAEKILIHGAMGGRLDMSIGNLMILGHPALKTPTTFINGAEEVHLLRAGDMLTLVGDIGDQVSLISLCAGEAVISTIGLLYPLKNEPLIFGETRGISNQLTQKRTTVHLKSGQLVVIHTRTDPLEGK